MGRGGAKIPFPGNGTGWCKWCGLEIIDPKTDATSRRRKWHPECVEAYKLTWPAVWRAEVWKKDAGQCQLCGRACGRWVKWGAGPPMSRKAAAEVMQNLRALGRPLDRGSFVHEKFSHVHFIEIYCWNADHVQPLADGGEWTLDNGQVACCDCHKAKTGREATARAARRRAAKEAVKPKKRKAG
jgi:5-methylcytosine-specific restriction endonuclease McrA